MTLEIREVSKHFGAFHAVRDVSFTVHTGRIFGFLGTNGAGKSTTMRMILDIIRPDAGEITWNQQPVEDLPRQMFGYLPEERGLYPKMRVSDQLIFLSRLSGADKSKTEAELDAWLKRFNVEENRDRPLEQLSKGNQQKVQFLAAILHDPDILVLDEPFSGLDPVNADQMEQALLEMRDRGKTVIFSTHQLDQAQELCQDVAIIHRGKLLATGATENVRSQTGRTLVRFASSTAAKWLPEMAGIENLRHENGYLEFEVKTVERAHELLHHALQLGDEVSRFEITMPSLNDVFLSLVHTMPEQDDRAAELLGAAR